MESIFKIECISFTIIKLYFLDLQFRLAADFSSVWTHSDSNLIHCWQHSMPSLLGFYWLLAVSCGWRLSVLLKHLQSLPDSLLHPAEVQPLPEALLLLTSPLQISEENLHRGDLGDWRVPNTGPNVGIFIWVLECQSPPNALNYKNKLLIAWWMQPVHDPLKLPYKSVSSAHLWESLVHKMWQE